MSNLDLAIAAQAAKLEYRQQRLQQRRDALRNGALNFCRKPGTLVGALVTGSILGFLYPAGRIERTHHAKPGGIRAFLQQNFSASLKLLMVNAIGRMFNPPPRDGEVEHDDFS